MAYPPPMYFPPPPQKSSTGLIIVVLFIVFLLVVSSCVWASNMLCDKTNPESQAVGMNCASVYDSSNDLTTPTTPTTPAVPAGMIKGKTIKVARTDNKSEHIGLLGIDIYDASGSRITTGMTASLSPPVPAATLTGWGGTADEFKADWLIDGIHLEWNGTTGKHRLPFTGMATSAFIQVSLASDTIISKIIIYVRPDDVARIAGTTLTVTDSAGVNVLTIPLSGGKTVYTFSAPLTNTSTSSTYMPQPRMMGTSAYVKESFSAY